MADSPASSSGGSGSDASSRPNVREQDRLLPITNIRRIMKKAIPSNGQIAKDAKETVQKCVSEFVSFITSEAIDKCLREKRKMINGDDLLWSMNTLGFEDYIGPLRLYLRRYRELEKDGDLLLGGTQPGSSTQGSQQGLYNQVTCDGSLYAECAELLGHKLSS